MLGAVLSVVIIFVQLMLLKVHKIKLAYYSGSETSPRSSKTFPSWSLAMKPLSVQKQNKGQWWVCDIMQYFIYKYWACLIFMIHLLTKLWIMFSDGHMTLHMYGINYDTVFLALPCWSCDLKTLKPFSLSLSDPVRLLSWKKWCLWSFVIISSYYTCSTVFIINYTCFSSTNWHFADATKDLEKMLQENRGSFVYVISRQRRAN